MKTFNIAILGCGRIGKMHLDLMLENFPQFNIIAIVENNLSKQIDYKGIPTYSSNETDIVLANPEIDAVVIAASSNAHVEIIKKAINYGKHIFCEKPISFDVKDLDVVSELAKKHNIKLQVGLNRRWDANFNKVQKLVSAGEIGAIQIVKITNRDPKRADIKFAKKSGGLFLDFNVHDFDMAHFITQSEVDEIYVNGAVLVDPVMATINDIDTAIISLKMKSGALVIIDASRETGYGYDQRLEVFGEKGCYVVNNLSETTTTFVTGEHSINDCPQYSFVERYKDAYINQLGAFLAYLHDSNVSSSPVSVGCVKKAVQVAMAANESLKKNKSIKVNYTKNNIKEKQYDKACATLY